MSLSLVQVYDESGSQTFWSTSILGLGAFAAAARNIRLHMQAFADLGVLPLIRPNVVNPLEQTGVAPLPHLVYSIDYDDSEVSGAGGVDTISHVHRGTLRVRIRFPHGYDVKVAESSSAVAVYDEDGDPSFWVTAFGGWDNGEEVAAALADHLRLAKVGQVKFWSPRISKGGLELVENADAGQSSGPSGWWTHIVEVPFRWFDQNRGRAADTLWTANVPGQVRFDVAARILRQRFDALVVAPEGLAVVHDNQAETAPPVDAVPWVRFAVGFSDSEIVDTAGTNSGTQTRGTAYATLLVALDDGDGEAWRLVDAVYDAFRGASDQGIRMETPTVRVVGKSDGWWQTNVVLPFHSEAVFQNP